MVKEIMKKPWHAMSETEVIQELDVIPEKGLSNDEAQKRLELHGKNEILLESKQSPWKLLLEQFKDMLVIILIISVFISTILGSGIIEGTEPDLELFIDAIAITVIVLLNAALGFYQEYKAEKALDALKKMTVPKAIVLREGKWKEIEARLLVPGDIIRIEQGSSVPADARLLESYNLRVDESTLTGESLPISKYHAKILSEQVTVADRINMVFLGTNVVKGRAVAIVTETGLQTSFGRIAAALQGAEREDTPLQQRLDQLGKRLGIVILLVCATIFGLGLAFVNEDPKVLFIAAVGLAVAAIPEGLPAVVTTALAIGVQRMASRKAIVRSLPAVETLGSTNVICSDKTGTLTENTMTVREVVCGVTNLQSFEVTGKGTEITGKIMINDQIITDINQFPLLEKIVKISVMCNNSKISVEDEKIKSLIGDPTENALLILGLKAGLNIEELLARYHELHEVPFDSNRKRMSVVMAPKTNSQKIIVFTKGAPEVILNPHITDRFLDAESGSIMPLTEEQRKKLLLLIEEEAQQGKRILAMAYKEIDKDPKIIMKDFAVNDSAIESNLIYVGFVAMYDPPRSEAREAIKKCRDAGIEVKMITGDHKTTATAIALQIGLITPEEVEEPNAILTGQDLETLGDEINLDETIEQVKVFARVDPEHKLAIVNSLKRKGHIVAMTGDGVNDAPALKRADIGVAMGLVGTDVAREAAEMVLLDDNFATIVNAIEEGRRIYDNIKKFILYMLASNTGEVLILLLGILAGLDLPLVAIQLLWINLVTDGLPALALGVDPPDKEIMKRKPRPPNESILTKPNVLFILFTGIYVGLASFMLFWWKLGFPSLFVPGGVKIDENELKIARSVTFTAAILLQKVIALAVRSPKNTLLGEEFFRNKWLLVAIIISIVLQFIVLYVPPVAAIFHVTGIGLLDWAAITMTLVIFFVLSEIYKFFSRKGYLPIIN